MTALVVTRCGSCGAPIVWTTTGDGIRMPCDAHPVVGGNVRILPTTKPGEPPRVVVGGNGAIDLFDPADDGVRYVSHFATCPEADEWRRTG